MPKAAIIIDKYKLPAFKRVLEKEGFVLETGKSIVPDSLTLNVSFEEKDAQKLSELVGQANTQAFTNHKLN